MTNKTNIDFDNIDFEWQPLSSKKSDSMYIDFEGDGPISFKPFAKVETEGFIKPTLKAIGKVVGAGIGSMILAPGAGIRAAIDLIPTISPDPDKKIRYGSLEEANKTLEEIMSVPAKLITTEEEVKSLEYINKSFELAATVGGVAGKKANEGLKSLGFEDTYLEPLFATYGEAALIFGLPSLVKRIKSSNTFRMMTIKERGLVIQSLADTVKKNPNMTTGQILRTFDNKTWRNEALNVRMLKPEEVISIKPKGKMPPMVRPETKPTIIAKQPKSEIAKTVQQNIIKERTISPLDILEQRVKEIAENKIDFEKPMKIGEPTKQLDRPIKETTKAIELPEATKEIEQPIPIKPIEDTIKKTKPIKQDITLKEQKEDLLSEIDIAIKKAPVEAPVDAYLKVDNKEGWMNRAIIDIDENPNFIKFEMPGDVTFRILNTKDALIEFRKNVKKYSLITKPKKITITKPKSSIPGKKERLDELVPTDKPGYFTDGTLLIKGDIPPKAKIKDTSNKVPEKIIDEFLTTKTNHAEVEYYAFDDPDFGIGVSPKPIVKLEPEQRSFVVFESKGKRLVYDQEKFNAIRNRYPKAKYGIDVDEQKTGRLLIAYENKKPVAVLAPINPIDFKGRLLPGESFTGTKRRSEDPTLYGGIPVLEGLKLKAELEALYDKHIGTPLWNFLSEEVPQWYGDKAKILDAVNRGIIVDYKKSPAFLELRDNTLFKIEKAKQKALELAKLLAKYPAAEQIRISQVIQGSITATPGRYKDALEVAQEFKTIEKELQRLGILGPDNRFKQLTKKAINKKFLEIAEIDKKIDILKGKLKPVVKTIRNTRNIIETAIDEIVSTSTDETTGAIETTVNRFTVANELRVKEALITRGFMAGEADTMITRIKESVIPIEGRTGTLREIRTQVKNIITKTITQEIEKIKTYSPAMMARARGSIVKEIRGHLDARKEILDRIKLHYKMSGKQYLRRAYTMIEGEKGFLKQLYGVAKRARLKLGYDIQRKDLSKNYKDYLGEIKKAPYLVYKGLSEETHDMYLMDMFDKISKNKDWAISIKEYDNIMKMKGQSLRQEKIKDFKPLPVSKKLGPLSGAMVDPYIWDDINQAVVVRSDMIKAYDKILTLWKTGKVVYNPASQVRNFLSGTIMADFAGVPHTRIDIYAKSARDLVTKSGYYLEAKETPLFGKEWISVESQKFYKEVMDIKRIGNENMLTKSADLFKKVLDKPGDLYQANEQYFKLLIFSWARENGMTIPQAYHHAEKWIFNYNKIPPAIRWAKRWYSPFITFSYLAAPRMVETATRKPWKFVKYGLYLLAIEEITRRMMGESKEEVEREKKVLPYYMRKTILPGQISHLRVPYTDKYNRSKYLDLSFILPWGDVAEQWGQSHIVGRPFLPNQPWMVTIAEIAFDEILFTGQKLTEKDLDTGLEYAKKIGAEIWRQAAPSLAVSYSYNKLMSALHGEKDWAQRERSLGEAVFDVFFGLKIRSIDYNEHHARRINELKGEIGIIRQRYSDDYEMLFLRQPKINEETKQKKYLKMTEKLDKDVQKIMDIITDIN